MIMPGRQHRLPIVAASVIGTVVACCALGLIAILTGIIPANADATPGKLETWAAKRSLKATLNRSAQGLHSPLPVDDSTLAKGVRLYGTYCADCHGAADGKPSAMARGMYQRPPQFAKDDVTDDPIGVTYWKITHGIRLTAMPAFDSTLTTDDRWAIATFLLRQDSLPPGAEAAWKKLPSSAESEPMRAPGSS
jgi:mono/diheme cytochrome c family protein